MQKVDPQDVLLSEEQAQIHQLVNEGLSLVDDFETSADYKLLSIESQASIAFARKLIITLAQKKTLADEEIQNLHLDIRAKQSIIETLQHEKEVKAAEKPVEDDQEGERVSVNVAKSQLQYSARMTNMNTKLKQAQMNNRAMTERIQELEGVISTQQKELTRRQDVIIELKESFETSRVSKNSKFFSEATNVVDNPLYLTLKEDFDILEKSNFALQKNHRELQKKYQDIDYKLKQITIFDHFDHSIKSDGGSQVLLNKVDIDNEVDVIKLRELSIVYKEKLEKLAMKVILLEDDIGVYNDNQNLLEKRNFELSTNMNQLENVLKDFLVKCQSNSDLNDYLIEDIDGLPIFSQLIEYQKAFDTVLMTLKLSNKSLIKQKEELNRELNGSRLKVREKEKKFDLLLEEVRNQEFTKYIDLRDQMYSTVKQSRSAELKMLESVSNLQQKISDLHGDLESKDEQMRVLEIKNGQLVDELERARDRRTQLSELVKEEASIVKKQLGEQARKLGIDIEQKKRELLTLTAQVEQLSDTHLRKKAQTDFIGKHLELMSTLRPEPMSPVVPKTHMTKMLTDLRQTQTQLRNENKILADENMQVLEATTILEEVIEEQDERIKHLSTTIGILANTLVRNASDELAILLNRGDLRDDVVELIKDSVPKNAVRPAPEETSPVPPKITKPSSGVAALQTELLEAKKMALSSRLETEERKHISKKLTPVAALLSRKRDKDLPEIDLECDELDSGMQKRFDVLKSVLHRLADAVKTVHEMPEHALSLVKELLDVDISEILDDKVTEIRALSRDALKIVASMNAKKSILTNHVDQVIDIALNSKQRHIDDLTSQLSDLTSRHRRLKREKGATLDDALVHKFLQDCTDIRRRITDNFDSKAKSHVFDVLATGQTEGVKLIIAAFRKYALSCTHWSLPEVFHSTTAQTLLVDFVEKLSKDIHFITSYTHLLERLVSSHLSSRDFLVHIVSEQKKMRRIDMDELSTLRGIIQEQKDVQLDDISTIQKIHTILTARRWSGLKQMIHNLNSFDVPFKFENNEVTPEEFLDVVRLRQLPSIFPVNDVYKYLHTVYCSLSDYSLESIELPIEELKKALPERKNMVKPLAAFKVDGEASHFVTTQNMNAAFEM
ncbi:hypothetical protein PCE1_002426 [Barthelona sp. PCE]